MKYLVYYNLFSNYVHTIWSSEAISSNSFFTREIVGLSSLVHVDKMIPNLKQSSIKSHINQRNY